jgi:hypothetical protein
LPHSPKKSLNYPKSTILFTLDQKLAEPYFSFEKIKFSQLHPVLINFRISSPSKQSKQTVDAKIYLVPAIIFSSASLRRFMLQNAAATPSEL